jgi:hypothetical protein
MLPSSARAVPPDLSGRLEALLCSRQLLPLPQQHPPR